MCKQSPDTRTQSGAQLASLEGPFFVRIVKGTSQDLRSRPHRAWPGQRGWGDGNARVLYNWALPGEQLEGG